MKDSSPSVHHQFIPACYHDVAELRRPSMMDGFGRMSWAEGSGGSRNPLEKKAQNDT
jgi:hypothetical protein